MHTHTGCLISSVMCSSQFIINHLCWQLGQAKPQRGGSAVWVRWGKERRDRGREGQGERYAGPGGVGGWGVGGGTIGVSVAQFVTRPEVAPIGLRVARVGSLEALYCRSGRGRGLIAADRCGHINTCLIFFLWTRDDKTKLSKEKF